MNMVNYVSWALGFRPNDSADTHKFIWTPEYGWYWEAYAYMTTSSNQSGPNPSSY